MTNTRMNKGIEIEDEVEAKGKAASEKGKPRILEIEKIANAALYGLRFRGGGQLPDSLNGHMFTSPTLAQQAIDNYEANREA